MTQAASHLPQENTPKLRLSDSTGLPGIPRRPLTPQEQAQAVKRLQEQAEKRLKLGMQLFQAAESQANFHRTALDQIKAEQKQIQQQMQEDMTRSLHQYDQWIGRIEQNSKKQDEDFNQRLEKLDHRLEMLQQEWSAMQQQLTALIQQAHQTASQTETLMQTIQQVQNAISPPPSAPHYLQPSLPSHITSSATVPVSDSSILSDPNSISFSSLLEKLQGRE